jgi:hypothetical protein
LAAVPTAQDEKVVGVIKPSGDPNLCYSDGKAASGVACEHPELMGSRHTAFQLLTYQMHRRKKPLGACTVKI